MPSYEWMQYKGSRILYMDIASQNTQELEAIVNTLKPVIEKEPPNSIKSVVSTKGGRFNKDIADILKDFTNHNKPYMKMTALVGVEGLQKTLYSAVILFTGRKNMILKDSKEEALEWLIGQ